MARSHLQKLLLDEAVGFLKGAQVAVVNNGGSTPITQTLWKNASTTTDFWPNPFISVDGSIDFYLDLQQTVSLVVTYGSKTVRYDAVQVMPLSEEVTRTLSPLTIENPPGAAQVPTGIDSSTAQWANPAPGAAPNGLPAGGTTGQILAKNSGTDYDAIWENAPSGGANVVVGQVGTALGATAIDKTINNASGGTVATSNGAIAIGIGDPGGGDIAAAATAAYALAIGVGTIANDLFGVAIGFYSKTGDGTAIGADGAAATGLGSTAIGSSENTVPWNPMLRAGATASGREAVAIGGGTQASGTNSTALGNYSRAQASGSIAIGSNGATTGGTSGAFASGAASIAIGGGQTGTNNPAQATASNAIAIGGGGTGSTNGALATGQSAIAIGLSASSTGQYAISMGINASSTNTGSVALGENATAHGDWGVAIGMATVESQQSVAIGDAAAITGGTNFYGVAIGSSAINNGTGQGIVAVGANTQASADYAVALGYQSSASAASATAIGTGTSAGFAGSVAIGADNAAGHATTTAVNQIMLGTSAHTVVVPGTPQFNNAGAGSHSTIATWIPVKDGAGTTYYVPAYS